MDPELQEALNATIVADSDLETETVAPETETAVAEAPETPSETPGPGSAAGEPVEEHTEQEFEINSPWLKEKTKYTESEIVEAIRGQMRESDYKSKTSELAEQRRSIESVRQFTEALKQADLEESLIETLQDAGIEDAEKLVKSAFEGEVIDHPDSGVLSETMSKVESLESELALIKSKDVLAKDFNLKAETVDAVYDFAVEHFDKTGQFLTLEQAYKVGDFGKKSKVTVVQPEVPTTPKVKPGVKPETEKQWPGPNDPLDARKHRLFDDD